MVAAVLDLHISSRLAAEAFDQMARRFRHRHDVVDLDPLGPFHRKRPEAPAFRLLLIADDVVDLAHGRERGGIDLRGAAGDHDLGVGPRPAGPPNSLAGLPHAFAGHRASVDDHRVGQTGGVGMLAHDFGFIGIQPAPEGDDLDLRHLLGF